SIMLAALVSVHLRYGFSSVRLLAITAEGAKFGPVGYELNLLYIAGLFTLVLGGPGALPLNRILYVKGRANLRRDRSLQIRPVVPADAEGIARTFLESAQYHARLDPDRYLLP